MKPVVRARGAQPALPRSVRLVIHRGGAFDTDGEAEAVDGPAANRAQAMDLLGRDVDEVTRTDGTLLLVDGHDTACRHHEVPLVRRVAVGEHRAAGRHLE